MSRLSALAAVALAVFACKTRDPAEPGLVASATAAETEAGGAWTVSCRETPDDTVEASAASTSEYRFDVRSPSSPRRAVADALVSVMRVDADGTTKNLATEEPGHALFSASGALLVDFAQGALTGEATTAPSDGDVTHVGVLTLTADDGASGLAVACGVREQNPDAVAVTATRE